ncbi:MULTISPECIES: TraR/DksA C4-type zinc finger protein [Acidithiobacillus]|uniref:TraR/DksA C4-type zinc finger protein n=1 Tax=Acidithiobacillus ferrivorans TaxID=160808 RepID=UPI001D01E5B1|nr:TraR/DksA C4-type zinc finger protein [Acidithiobacillus ferrivorans]
MMDIEPMESCADPLDQASKRELQQIEAVLADRRTALANRETPDEDDAGNRYCLDCAETIDPKRVAAVDAVRCVACATVRERQAGRKWGKGGALQFVDDQYGGL